MPRGSALTACIKCGKKPRFGLSAMFYMLKAPVDPSRPQFKRTLPAVGYCRKCLFKRLSWKGIPKKVRKRLISEIDQELHARQKG